MVVVEAKVGGSLSFPDHVKASPSDTRSGSGSKSLNSRQMLKSFPPFLCLSLIPRALS